MQDIINTDLLKIAIEPLKHRLYCIITGFWQPDDRKAACVRYIFQQLSRQQSMRTMILDTSGMKIVDRRAPEHFFDIFIRYLLDTPIKAFAHVENPDSVLLHLHFERALNRVQRLDEVPHETFHWREDAEQWLDTL